MFPLIGIFCVLLTTVQSQEQAEHRNFQYNSAIDPLTGRYNFAYDTGNDNDIAHSMHMQYQDADGIVRGRYGYTDPNGKLRMVEYEAGPQGFIARGDVGPDQSLHDNAPTQTSSGNSALSSYQEGDYNLDPAPVQMAGWNPEENPITNQNSESGILNLNPDAMESEESYLSPFDRSLFPSVNITSNSPLTIYDSDTSDGTDRSYGRIIYSADENQAMTRNDGIGNYENNQSENKDDSEGVNINNINVDPNSIRATSESNSVDQSVSNRSSEDLQETPSRAEPVKVTAADGRRLFYRDSHSQEPHEHYYFRPTHDHDSERRVYYPSRYTHDHDAEKRVYYPRYTHDHDAEVRRYYRPRVTHDHDAETRRYYRPRYTHNHDSVYVNTHDHDANWNVYQRVYKNGRVYYRDRHSDQLHAHSYDPYLYQRVYRNGKVYYRDRHSNELHPHASEPYEHHVNHQHSDVHLYSGYRYRNSDYPATAKPQQLQYIPSDKYHDKDYYWTTS